MKKITAFIKPGSKKGPLVSVEEDGLHVVYVREPAVEGKANSAAVQLLARHYGVAKSRVTLQRGATSRYKTFVIAD